MTQDEQFKKMLERDREIFANAQAVHYIATQTLSKYALAPPTEVLPFSLATQARLHLMRAEAIMSRYNARQNDLRTNPTYKAAQALEEAGQSIKTFFAKLFGVGILPALPAVILLPLIYSGAAVLSVAIIAYFVSSYYEEVSIDYNESLELIGAVAQNNPELANQMLADLQKAKQTEQQTGLGAELGKALKYAGFAVVAGVIAKVGYDIYKSNS